MLYSRHNLPSLNIDLTELPIEEGSRNLYALATDGSHIGIRVSGSCVLEVRSSPKQGTRNFFEMENILYRERFFPHYIDQPNPYVFCDLLDLTVQGERIESRLMQGRFDLSGKTAYWGSAHIVKTHDVSDHFIELAQQKIPEARLFQKVHYKDKVSKWREVSAFEDQDEIIILGIGNNRSTAVDKLNKSDQPFTFFPLTLGLNRRLAAPEGCKSYTDVNEEYERREKELGLPVIKTFHYSLSAQFKEDNTLAQSYMMKLKAIIENHFK